MGIKIDLKKIVGGLVKQIPGIGPIANQLLFAVDEAEAAMTPEQRISYDVEMAKLQTEDFRLALQDSADVRKLAAAELQSDSPLAKNARPGILVAIAATTLGLIIFWLMIVPFANGVGADIQYPAAGLGDVIPDQLWWLFGSSFLGYGAYREYGKKQKLDHGVKQ